jgi:hypothetical protein
MDEKRCALVQKGFRDPPLEEQKTGVYNYNLEVLSCNFQFNFRMSCMTQGREMSQKK